MNNCDPDYSSSYEEEWDETDIEVDVSNTKELHPLAKPFVKWIAALILGQHTSVLLSGYLPFYTYYLPHFVLYVLPLSCWQFSHYSLVHYTWLGGC